jgi:DNA-binding MarR family transcriptional regulator
MPTQPPHDAERFAALRAEFRAAQEAERKQRTPEAAVLLALAKQHGGNVDDMARQIGVSRSTIYRRLRAEGLTRKVHNMRESFRMFSRLDTQMQQIYGETKARSDAAYQRIVYSTWSIPLDI